jgi:hypothetical protein
MAAPPQEAPQDSVHGLALAQEPECPVHVGPVLQESLCVSVHGSSPPQELP